MRGAVLLTVATLVGVVPGTVSGQATPSASPGPSTIASPQASPTPRSIPVGVTRALRFVQGRDLLTMLAVRPGETVTISFTNGAGFAHNLYIGPYEALAANQVAGLPGVPEFEGRTASFTWSVPSDVTGLWFGCTVTGHFQLMQGPVVAVASIMPDLVGLAEEAAVALLDASGLRAEERVEAAHPTAPTGIVTAQEPVAGTPIEIGVPVSYTVSAGPESGG